MDVTPVLAATAKPVDSYAPGQFRVAGAVWVGAVWLQPALVQPAPVSSYAELTLEHLAVIFTAPDKPDVLLLGVGALQDSLPPKAWRDAARAAGVVLEAMNTGAACRTWNVLLLEGRRVQALLFPV